MSDLVFLNTDSFYRAQGKILARMSELGDEETLVGSEGTLQVYNPSLQSSLRN